MKPGLAAVIVIATLTVIGQSAASQAPQGQAPDGRAGGPPAGGRGGGPFAKVPGQSAVSRRDSPLWFDPD